MGLFSKDDLFFDFLNKQIEIAYNSSVLVLDFGKELTESKEKIYVIKENEHICDNLLKEIAQKLNNSFITPIDREDLYKLASQIDDIMDMIDELAHCFGLYNITVIRPEAVELMETLVSAILWTKNLIEALPNRKNKEPIDKACEEIDKYENIADQIYFSAVGKLFREENNPIEVIKWEKMFATLENTVNQCKEVANTVHTVIIKDA